MAKTKGAQRTKSQARIDRMQESYNEKKAERRHIYKMMALDYLIVFVIICVGSVVSLNAESWDIPYADLISWIVFAILACIFLFRGMKKMQKGSDLKTAMSNLEIDMYRYSKKDKK